MCCSKVQFVTSTIVSGVVYLTIVTAVANSHEGDNAVNIMAFIGSLFILFVHALAMCDLIIVKSDDKPLGEWPKGMHILALVPASVFMLFWPLGAGVHALLRFFTAVIGAAMFCEHTTAFIGSGLYGREAQARKTGIFSEYFPC